MEQARQIKGLDFVAQVQGNAPWRFSYFGSLNVEVESYGQQVIVLHSQIRQMLEAEQEQLFDVFWTLAKELGFENVCISYRLSDPFETYIVRPERSGMT